MFNRFISIAININKHRIYCPGMWHTHLLILLLIVGTKATMFISITCQQCSCISGTCAVYDGGPFNNNSFCSNCIPETQSTVDIGCSCSLKCGYLFSALGT